MGVLRFPHPCFWFAVVKHAEHEGCHRNVSSHWPCRPLFVAALTTAISRASVSGQNRLSPLDGSLPAPAPPALVTSLSFLSLWTLGAPGGLRRMGSASPCLPLTCFAEREAPRSVIRSCSAG